MGDFLFNHVHWNKVISQHLLQISLIQSFTCYLLFIKLINLQKLVLNYQTIITTLLSNNYDFFYGSLQTFVKPFLKLKINKLLNNTYLKYTQINNRSIHQLKNRCVRMMILKISHAALTFLPKIWQMCKNDKGTIKKLPWELS